MADEQQQPEQPPFVISPAQAYQEDRSTLAIATDPAKLLVQIEHSLKGEIMAEDGTWIPKTDPLVNELGIGAIILDLSSKLSHNTTLTNLTEKEIHNLIMSIARRISVTLAMNKKQYGMKVSNLSLIKNIICEPIFFALKRAQNQGERKFWSKTTSEQRNILERPQQRKGLLDGIFNPNK